jgi:hypothetical protein
VRAAIAAHSRPRRSVRRCEKCFKSIQRQTETNDAATNDVLDQHLKCFYENDLEGVLADYSSDAVLFIPGRRLKARTRSSHFSRLSCRNLPSLVPRFRCASSALQVITPTFYGVQKPRTIHTKPLPTRSWCGAGRSSRNPLLPRSLQSVEQLVRSTSRRCQICSGVGE